MTIDQRLAALHKKYPTAYPAPHGNWNERQWPFEIWGFQCGPGWADILDKLGAVMEAHGVRAHQVKEKVGGLRVYTGARPDEVTVAIRAAEIAACTVCEQCGEPGELCTVYGWLKTYCRGCYESELARFAIARGKTP